MSNFGDHPAGFFGDSSFYNGVATQSLRFDDGSSAYLTRTPSASNRKTHTLSMWVKRCELGGGSVNNSLLRANGSGDTGRTDIFFDANDKLNVAGSSTYFRITNRQFRDVSSWYHIVFALDTTDGTADNRLKIYVNGVQETSFATNNAYSQNTDYGINGNVAHQIGTGYDYFDGYMAEVNFVDGSQLDPTSFGEFKNGVWIAKKYTGSYGTNGFRLQLDQTGVGTASASTIGADTSGNTHHFTSSGIVASDCAMPDSPENNFATMNPLSPFQVYNSNNVAYADGNLNLVHSGQAYAFTASNFAVKTGKWYAEMRFNTNNSGEVMMVGISEANMEKYYTGDSNDPHLTAGTIWYISDGGGYYDGSSQNAATFSGGVTWGNHDTTSPGFVIGIALDLDSGTRTVTFTKDGGNSFSKNLTSNFTDHIVFANNVYSGTGGGNHNFTWNFGQDSTFGGLETATTNTDANGNGTFHSAVPSGYLSLCSNNLEEPTIGPNSTAGNSTDFFDTVLYAGNDTANHVIPASGDTPESINFSPDWISVKTRSGNDNHSHFWITSSLGSGDYIKPDATGASSGSDFSVFADESTWAANTFRTGSGVTLINGSGTNHVAWLWKNNGGTTSNLAAGTNASVNTNQVNQTAGISFNNFTTSTRDGSDVVFKHGLGVAPDWIMLKGMESNNYIAVYSAAAGGTNLGLLGNDTNSGNVGDDVWASSNGYWGTIDATNVTFADNGNTASSGEEIFAWCFAAKEGFSKFGVYQGNGNADGAFIYTGFRPAFVMIKSTTVAGQYWVIKDTRRDPINPATRSLYWNVSDAEGTGILLDILSNGFKPRTTGNNHNNSGGTYAYMAFAEQPFKYANAR